MRKNAFILLAVLAIAVANTACGPFNKLLKSGDNDKIYAEGLQMLDLGKFSPLGRAKRSGYDKRVKSKACL